MVFCSKNLTIGVFISSLFSSYISIENNVITGTAGRHYDQFLVYRNERNCIFRPILFFKDLKIKEFRNYSAEFMLRSNRIDLYSMPDVLELTNEFLEMSEVAANKPLVRVLEFY